MSSMAARDSGSIASHRSRWLDGTRRSAASSRICASISSAFMWNFVKRRSEGFGCATDLSSSPVLRLVSNTFVDMSLFDSASTDEPADVDTAFLGEHFDRRRSAHRRKPIVSEQLRERENAEAIDSGSRRQSLIAMPAAPRHQQLVDQPSFVVD